jgi:hypothetical protein
MLAAQQLALAERALEEIEQLLNKFDLGGQIKSVLPLLLRHRCTLVELCNAPRPSHHARQQRDDETWANDLVSVYQQLGGQAPHSLVYRKMKEARMAAGRSWPGHAEELIRQTLQAHNAESPQYRDGLDLFRMVRPGLWRLKEHHIH